MLFRYSFLTEFEIPISVHVRKWSLQFICIIICLSKFPAKFLGSASLFVEIGVRVWWWSQCSYGERYPMITNVGQKSSQ